jgi:diketogulonate reductase-like aldo/keto reductase
MDVRSTLTLRSGARMPVLGLGTWELTSDTAETVLHALRSGYRMIDTACDYGSQPGIGQALKRYGRREDVYLVAKVEEDEDAYQATRRYLREMGVDYADLMLIHRPPEDGAGEALWRGLARARLEGYARDIGVSNYAVEQLSRLTEATGETPIVNQIEWSPFGHSAAMLDYCRARGIVIQAYSPLTRGERLDDEALVDIAQRYGRTPAQMLIRWNLQQGVAPLPKANRREHLEENIDVFDFVIDDADMSALNRLNEHYSALGSLAYA